MPDPSVETKEGLSVVYTFLLREVDELDGSGYLPPPNDALDELLRRKLIGLASPRGLYLTDAGRALLDAWKPSP